MIIGLGTDIIKVSRIEKMLQKHQKAFLQKIFTKAERINAEDRKNIYQHLAGRLAAKEAFSKALGYGIGDKCAWKDIAIINDSNGKPSINLCGDALQTITALSVTNIHLSISHETSFAVATVILEGNNQPVL